MAEPTKRPEFIEQMLTSLTGAHRPSAILADVCVFCGDAATVFTDEKSRKEFSISGMCQNCQDATFDV